MVLTILWVISGNATFVLENYASNSHMKPYTNHTNITESINSYVFEFKGGLVILNLS